MKDEIKEILDYISDRVIEKEKWNKVRDYITTLQEENENLKDFNNKLQATKDRLDKYDRENQMRIDKAIDFINKNKATIRKDQADFYNEDKDKNFLRVGTFMWHIDELLNILQGEQK